jgi:hypothetical protein
MNVQVFTSCSDGMLGNSTAYGVNFNLTSSQLKHVMHSDWPPSQFEMIQKLYESGGNRVWETLLLDPNKEAKNKIRAGDSTERRESFIKEKYVYQGMD